MPGADFTGGAGVDSWGSSGSGWGSDSLGSPSAESDSGWGGVAGFLGGLAGFHHDPVTGWSWSPAVPLGTLTLGPMGGLLGAGLDKVSGNALDIPLGGEWGLPSFGGGSLNVPDDRSSEWSGLPGGIAPQPTAAGGLQSAKTTPKAPPKPTIGAAPATKRRVVPYAGDMRRYGIRGGEHRWFEET